MFDTPGIGDMVTIFGRWYETRVVRIVVAGIRQGAMIDAEPEGPQIQAYKVSIPSEELA